MQRLTWQGVALHAGNLPGYPASHGCIRLPLAFAKLLYGVSALGMTVVITNDADVPVVATPQYLTGSGVVEPGSEGFTWHPERAPSGPLSIVVSGQYRRLIVLRNGIEIGSGAIRFDGPITTTVAYSYLGRGPGGERWVRLPLPGQPVQTGAELTEADRSHGQIAEGLRTAIASVLMPGTSLLVTRSSLRSSGVGHKLTVITTGQR